jgi:acetyltransferase-like isoleucine patch superfamily enzyme
MNQLLRSVYYDGLLFIANRVVSRLPSHSFRLLFYRHIMGFSIGPSSYVFMDAWFDTKGKGSFIMGRNSVVNQKCRLDNRGSIIIGDNVSVSAEVCILTADHDLQSPDFKGRTSRVSIGDFAFIGTRAMLLPGVKVGKGAAVAAGAIVTRDVPERAIVGGCPAKQIGTRNSAFEYTTIYHRRFC